MGMTLSHVLSMLHHDKNNEGHARGRVATLSADPRLTVMDEEIIVAPFAIAQQQLVACLHVLRRAENHLPLSSL